MESIITMLIFNRTNKIRVTIILTIMLSVLLNTHKSFAKDLQQEIKSYINNIKSTAVEFTQTDSNSEEARGMLIINKPYKFRCNYYEPFPLLIVGNKNYVSVYDYEMENLSRMRADENIFNFLLLDEVNFDNKFEVLFAKEHLGKYIIRLKHTTIDKISEITFNKETKNIKEIKIIEDNNIITLSFSETKKIYDVANNLFILKNPDIFDKPERLNKEQLQKNFKLYN